MHSLTLTKITIPYNRELLLQWKERDTSIVPAFMLNLGGPGISNGYGFGEWYSEQYFREQGNYVFSNEFNLLSKTSKFDRYNRMIGSLVGHEKLLSFKRGAQQLNDVGCAIENPDLFVYNLESCFFAEVKKEKDQLREPQLRFMYLTREILGVESKLVYLCDRTKEIKIEEDCFTFTMPEMQM